jgi:putative transposase
MTARSSRRAPNQRWGTDATMAWTRADGWVWVFACIDHYTAEAWAHVAKVGDRFAALQPVYDAVIDRWGRLDADVARGLALRHDWGPQYRSAHFTGSLAWLGISDDPAFLGEPETNGCAEPWIRTLTEQCLWVQLHDTVEELGQAVAGFVERSNSSWLIQRHSHQTPKEPISQHNRQQRHDQVGTTSVQETGRCSVRQQRGSGSGPGRPTRRPARDPAPPGGGAACLAGAWPPPRARHV